MTPSSHLAISMGDPAGVGPEIILQSVQALAERDAADPVALTVVGEETALDAAASTLGVDDWRALFGKRVRFVRCAELDAPHSFGQVRADCGNASFRAVERAVELVRAGEADALVTAPLNKEALHLAGHRYSGHTEILADLTGVPSTFMMLAHGDFRVSHVTTHVALSRVGPLLTHERVTKAIAATDEMLRRIGIARPRLAMAAFNPHAGEAGAFGTEDDDVLAPAVAAMRERGVDVVGPVPGDTVFVRAAAGQFDCVVANYHDQGHIPVKLLGFKIDRESGRWTGLSGVNVTLGLPIIRTSVDHGTAFDIAGKGIANERSLIEAVEFAEKLAATRRAA